MNHSDTISRVLQTIPADKLATLKGMVDQLQKVEGIVAIVLGGSYARGAYHATSDLDVGLYYHENAPFDIDQIRQIANAFGEATVTGFYEWGAWVNGGAWIHTASGKVDFLYRNIEHVSRVLHEAKQGKHELDYLQQPPFGFPSVIYLAETSICLPLYDPKGIIADLKALVDPYPPALKANITQNMLWSVDFTLTHARTFAAQGDVYTTVGCLTRAMSFLTQVLFALNETYFISDKKAIAAIDTFALKPPNYSARVNHILGHAGNTTEELAATVRDMEDLFHQVVELTEGTYKPRFVLR
jgi:predicted nucleotidyltransferase